MTHPRRALLSTFAGAILLGSVGGLSAQEPFPSKPIHVIVPYPAGGTTDQLARAIQKPMADFLGQPVIVENKAGAGGTIGTEAVARATPDGHTIVFGNTGPNAVVGLLRKIPYDPLGDLLPISTVAIAPMILAVPASSPATTLKEFLALAKQRSADMNYGSVGNGSLSHLTGEYFNSLAGLQLTHVPYKGGAPMSTALASGEVQAAFVTGLDGAAMASSGKVKYLAVGTPDRSPVVPGLPAIADEVPGFRSIAWFGVLGPRGLPAPVAEKLHAAVVAAVAQPDVTKMLEDRNVEARSSSPAEMEKMIKDEMAQWGEVIKRSSIKVE